MKPRIGSLADEFGLSPFSVLNAREGWWQKRKKKWLELGIDSENGRDQYLVFSPSASAFLTKDWKQNYLAKRPGE